MIEVTNLTKDFRVFRGRAGILKYLLGLARKGRDYDTVRSLDAVNLSVPQGKVRGIIGLNGAGKSTLLKILTGVLLPSSGSVKICGRVAALLELGTGFHPDLTGRENVYLNGSLLGLSRSEIAQRIDDIINFSELGDFFDRKIKIYSSGMYVRLAFAFAVSVDPDVLIIDEALSVGDAYFQQKCLKKIQEFKARGITILFVSHDLGAVRMLCDEVTLLLQGKVIYSGDSLKALDLYNALLAEHRSAELVRLRAQAAHEGAYNTQFASGNLAMEVVHVDVVDDGGKNSTAVISGENISIRVHAKVNAPTLVNPTCGILLKDRLGNDVFGTNTFYLGIKTGELAQGKTLAFHFSFPCNLGAGEYTLSVTLHSDRSHVEDNYHWIDRCLLLRVLPSNDFEFIGVSRLEPSVQVNFT